MTIGYYCYLLKRHIIIMLPFCVWSHSSSFTCRWQYTRTSKWINWQHKQEVFIFHNDVTNISQLSLTLLAQASEIPGFLFFFSWKERSETKVMKIENEEQPILRGYTNFELDLSVHVRTGAENVHAWTLIEGTVWIKGDENRRGRTDNLKTNLIEKENRIQPHIVVRE